MILDLPEAEQFAAIAAMSSTDLAALRWQLAWDDTARDKQTAPEGDWSQWGVMAGRGFGKTLLGAQWIAWEAWCDPEALPSAVICPTQADVRYTAFEGPAGIISIVPPELVKDYNRSDLIITLVNGATIRGFSAEKAERLRGPQHARIWCDELAAWQYADDTWDMAMMGLRLGPAPQILWTTTPKPIELVRKLVTPQPGRVITRGSTYENRDHLPQTFFDQLVQYEGTTIGRQELDGELIDPEEAGIIKRSWLRLWPAKKPLPPFDWIVMSLDTAFTEATTDRKNGADFSACTVWGVFRHEERSQVLLLDCWQEQLGLPDLMKRVKRELNVAYGDDQDTALIKPLFGSSKMASAGRKVDICVIEDKGSGISLRQMLDREGITAYAYNPGRADKLSRLHMVSSVFARRQVWLPESDKHPKRPRTWVEPMLAQLCAFTGAGSIKHDDFVDSCSQAIRLLMDKNMLSAMKLDKKGSEPEYVPPKHYTNPYAS